MARPIDIDIPHELGRATARSRIDGGLAKLPGFLPGGSIEEQRWDGDVLNLTIAAMGQRVAARIEVFEDRAHATFDLPPMLALFAGKVRDQIVAGGQKLLK